MPSENHPPDQADFFFNGSNTTQAEFALSNGVRVFFNGSDELRIRKGIWNYEEGVLSLGEMGERLRDAFIKFFTTLDKSESIWFDEFVQQASLAAEEVEQFNGVVQALLSQNYLRPDPDFVAKHFLYDLIGGTMASNFYSPNLDIQPVLLFSDSESVTDYAKSLANEIALPLEIMSPDTYLQIARSDLTSRTEGLETQSSLRTLVAQLKPYSCILGCLQQPSVSFLRNLNRVLIENSTVLSLALLDGPFTSILTIKPPETGCFECYENRLWSRMQDMSVYQEYVAHTRKHPSPIRDKTFATPIMHSLVSQVIFEGFLVSTIGRAKLAGRALNTYLPIMELQVQDLVRVPFCPACGFVSKARIEETYTSTKRIVDRITESVIIDNS